MDELIRGKIHDALDVEPPDDDLRSRIVASLPVEQRPAPQLRVRSLQVAGGLVAALLAAALIVALLNSRGTINPQPAQGGQCLYLYSPGIGSTVQTDAITVINESTSTTCTLKAPTISYIDASGNQLDVPQYWAPGAEQAVLRLGPLGAAAIPFSIQPNQCGLNSKSLDYVYIRATFGAGVELHIPAAGNLCQGMRIIVSAPVPAVTCSDGAVTWASPSAGGTKPIC